MKSRHGKVAKRLKYMLAGLITLSRISCEDVHCSAVKEGGIFGLIGYAKPSLSSTELERECDPDSSVLLVLTVDIARL